MVLLVSYDRTTDGRPEKFDGLDVAIDDAAIETQRPSRSVWLVQTDEDVSVWGPRLGELLEPDDRMVIVRVPNMPPPRIERIAKAQNEATDARLRELERLLEKANEQIERGAAALERGRRRR